VKHLFYHTDPIAALAEQGVDLEQPAADAAGESGAPAPGTGQQSQEAPAADSSAGTENAETDQSSGPPDNVPYSRFKEVNDQLRPFKEVEQLGYDANSLRQLAEWGVQFDNNPVDSWLSLAKELDDLPPDVKAAVEAHLGNQEAPVQQQTSQPQGQQKDDEEPPSWAKELKERLDQREAEEAKAEREQTLDKLVSDWKEQDKKDGIASPKDTTILTFINANTGLAKTLPELLEMARKEWLDDRTATLTGSVRQEGHGAPSAVPGSGAPVQEAPPKPRSLEEVNKQIEQAIAAGTFKTD
jgi:hypothetical protein